MKKTIKQKLKGDWILNKWWKKLIYILGLVYFIWWGLAILFFIMAFILFLTGVI